MLERVRNHSLITKIIIGVIADVMVGIWFPVFSTRISFIGDIFLRLMQMVIPLLELGQIVQALWEINLKQSSLS